jgi:hypothetical protein
VVLTVVFLTAAAQVGSRAQAPASTVTSFGNSASGCTTHAFLHLSPWGVVDPCDPSIPPSIGGGDARETHSASADGSFDVSASASGGTQGIGGDGLESWIAQSVASFTASITTGIPTALITLVTRVRIDAEGYDVVGGGDMGAYGEMSATPVATGSSPCGSATLKAIGGTKATFYEGTPPGTYEFQVQYACSDGATIAAGQEFDLTAFFIAHGESHSASGNGTAITRGQMLSYAAALA